MGMKTFRILPTVVIILIIAFTPTDSQTQEWSEPIQLSPGVNPDLTINNQNGTLHLVSVVDPRGVLYLSTDKFGNVLDSVIVPNTSGEEGLLKFGPTIGVDTKNNPHVGYRIHRGNNKYDIYYINRVGQSWISPMKVGSKVLRGYVTRIAVDGDDRVHFAHGSVDPDYPNITGPVHYYLIDNGSIEFSQHNIDRIRGDERFEMDVSGNGIVDLTTSDLHYPPDPPEGGPIYYWRTAGSGDSLTYRGDIHDLQTRQGANGSSDVFVDAAGNTHVCYGAEKDNTVGGGLSIRYSRQENGETVFDRRVTGPGEISKSTKVPIGIGSVAASSDGEIVVIAYITEEDGPLYTRFSSDGGNTWSEPVLMASGWNSAEARNKHIIRAYRGDFYLVYPNSEGIAMRYLLLTPNEPPVAVLAAPDSASEGSTINFDATGSYDTDGTVTTCYWDFQNDGFFDDTTDVLTNSYTYVDDFSGQASITVVDNEGDADSTTADVKIYNLPPVADAGDTYQTTWYTPVNLTGTAIDPGINDVLTYSWDLDFDGIFETAGQNTQSPAYSLGDTHYVALQVTDDDGGVDMDSAMIVINNQPPVISDILDQIINEGETFSPVYLNEFVADPDNPDSTLTWEITDDDHVTVSVDDENVATITINEPNWSGSDTVTFKVTDTGGRSDSDVAIFTIITVNDPPIAFNIPNQSGYENDPFTPLLLDNYVSDPDDPDSSLSWIYYDADYLSAEILNRMLHVTVLDSEWAGLDTIGLIVSDMSGLKDTTAVTYEVKPVNDPPVVSRIDNQEIYQNQEFPTFNMDELVFDPDLPDSLIEWTWAGNSRLQLSIDADRILRITRSDTSWTGGETIVFWATDDEGLYDLFTTTFTVKPGYSSHVASGKDVLPSSFALHPNYPNPFNPSTHISYEIPKRSPVEIRIYNQLGHEVRTLVNETHDAGSYRVLWDARDNNGNRVTSGVYYYRMKAGNFVRTNKMVLIY
ncbi:T9SS type A sorting domain-containing protein [candidate division KSB1 bacterium]|nr:T9SS type A sorting domain-containing protein [candidate division KSB1 bacterium]